MDVKEIPLPCGRIALVDAILYPAVIRHKWISHTTETEDVVYAAASIQSKQITMHRFVFGSVHGRTVIDHIDRNGLNNCLSNLRVATVARNAANKRKQVGKYSSRFKGVHWRPDAGNGGKWRAFIECDKKRETIGYFSTQEEAAIAYNARAVQLFGEFARLNELPIPTT